MAVDSVILAAPRCFLFCLLIQVYGSRTRLQMPLSQLAGLSAPLASTMVGLARASDRGLCDRGLLVAVQELAPSLKRLSSFTFFHGFEVSRRFKFLCGFFVASVVFMAFVASGFTVTSCSPAAPGFLVSSAGFMTSGSLVLRDSRFHCGFLHGSRFLWGSKHVHGSRFLCGFKYLRGISFSMISVVQVSSWLQVS
ncbi:hypothetical protein BJ138DRAFT_1149361 [Hygrophoropsis aurantiaca]|uniref:Uncharacterized protein n=1 Tax=Hygrophoropsis aurantiaca TaxID=72124 RepID=A0ACB8AG64_9AGAM|nr:hypothetical protein BJ138DRAFT_1149361 [Hygrophoropsis aurantiaca]